MSQKTPRIAGGKSILSNCRMLCKACNRRKGGV
ncbi:MULTISPECIES: HNH endonuclease [Burkholderia]